MPGKPEWTVSVPVETLEALDRLVDKYLANASDEAAQFVTCVTPPTGGQTHKDWQQVHQWVKKVNRRKEVNR